MTYPIVLAHPTNYRVGRARPLSRIGLHCTQTGPDTATGVANFFAHPHYDTHGKLVPSSAHVTVGKRRIVTSVRAVDTAYAMPNVNADGWHLELCGYAEWTARDWSDGPSHDVLLWGANVAAQSVKVFRFFGTPFDVRELEPDELRAGAGFGFVRHARATNVLGPFNGHTDPGRSFPLAHFFDLVEWWIPRIDRIELS